ncbi:MAG: hypothetical protein GYA86_07610 [Firmicutes bacterium]|nr:hypothetical protein [Bacillota bacterium]
MDRKESITLVLLFVVIIFSGIGLLSLKGLGDRLEGLQGQVQSLQSRVQGEIGEVADLVQALQEQALLWKPEEIEIVKIGLGRASLKLGWHLKEYRVGSKVSFNYRRQGEPEYSSLEVAESSGGYFHVLLDLEFNPEPLWGHQYTSSLQCVPTAEVWPDDPRDQYEYYISVVDEETIRSGEPGYLSPEKLSEGFYSYLHSSLDLGKKSVSVDLTEEKYGEPRFTMTAGRLELCRGDEVVKWLPLVKSAGEELVVEWAAEIMAEVEKECNAVCLVVTFSDGESFSRRLLLDR